MAKAGRLALPEPLASGGMLTPSLATGIKLYHLAHDTVDIEQSIAELRGHGAKLVEPPVEAIAFHHGHRRIPNPGSFRRCFLDTGLNVEMFGGYWLKPLSNLQLEACRTAVMLEPVMQPGERYPDITGEMYVIAGR